MNVVIRLQITSLTIYYALFPPRPRTGADATPDTGTELTPATIGRHFEDLTRSMASDGSLTFFIPGCLAVAAPVLLFHLKRRGYSACRATVTPTGLLLEATR